MLLPPWPEPGERNPERAIERREPGARPASSVDRELLSKGQLDHNLICVASEWRAKTVQKTSEEAGENLHGRSILREPRFRSQSESRSRPAVSFKAGRAETGQNVSDFNAEEF